MRSSSVKEDDEREGQCRVSESDKGQACPKCRGVPRLRGLP